MVKHFLAHNLTFENLKPHFSQLKQQHITGVIRNLRYLLARWHRTCVQVESHL